MWESDIQLSNQNKSQSFTQLSETLKLTCTEVISSQYFYLQNPKSVEIGKINQILESL